MDRIAINKSIVVTPVIDTLDDSNLKYINVGGTTFVGGMKLGVLTFDWVRTQSIEIDRRKRLHLSDFQPLR